MVLGARSRSGSNPELSARRERRKRRSENASISLAGSGKSSLTRKVRSKAISLRAPRGKKEAYKGARGMPRLSETTKDVISCEKLRGVANKH